MPAPLSVVIPALNAADDLQVCLASLMPGLDAGLIKEVILVDGGSGDATVDIAADAGCRIVESAPGRATQLRAGAATARGNWLLFLHADTALSRDWADQALAHMRERPDRAAAFTLKYRSDDAGARWLEKRAAVRAALLGLPYGDQGLLVSRSLYDEVGGFAPVPLMEDVMIVRAIGKARLSLLSAQAHTSGAKYERDGWRRRGWANFWLLTRFLLGASPEKLAASYR